MSSTNPFTPVGNTVAFIAASTAPAGVQASGNTLGPTQYLIQNSGLSTVFLGFGSTNALAYGNAVTITSTGNAVPLLASTVQVLTLMPNLFFTGVSTSSATVFITPGEGT